MNVHDKHYTELLYFSTSLIKIGKPIKFTENFICRQLYPQEVDISNGFIYIKNLLKDYQSKSSTNYYAEISFITAQNRSKVKYNKIVGDNQIVPLYVSISYNKRKGCFCFSKSLLRFLHLSYIDVWESNTFMEIANLYLNWKISGLKYNKITGWNKYNYVGITSPEIYSTELSEPLFNGALSELYSYETHTLTPYISNCDTQPEPDYVSPLSGFDIKLYANKLTNTFLANPKLLIIFAYSLMAIGNNIFTLKELDYDLAQYYQNKAALCICGNSKHITAFAIANIFSNMLDVDTNQINNIIYNSKNINISKTIVELRRYKDYSDITLLVYSKKHNLSASNYYVKHIITTFLNKDINYHPVFTSQKPLNLQECFDVDISNFTPVENGFSLTSAKEIADLKKFINGVYIEFIRYISDLCYQYKQTYNTNTSNSISSILRKEHNDIKNHTNALSSSCPSSDNIIAFYQQLLMFVYLFKMFISKHGFDKIGTILYSLMFGLHPYFYDETQLKANNPKSPVNCFKVYIKSIFVDKTYTPPYKYFEGMDRGDGKGYCYYLEGNKYFDDFSRRYSLSITHVKFNKILKELGLIKTRADNSSVVLSRINNGQRGNYLVVLKEKIES